MSARRSGAAAREVWLLGSGAAALLAGAAILLVGPFDGSARRVAQERIDDLRQRIETALKEEKSLKAKATETRGQIRAAERRAAEGRRAAEKLQTQRSILADLDGQLQVLAAAAEEPAPPAAEEDPTARPPGVASGLAADGTAASEPVAAVEAPIDSGLTRAEKAVVVIRTDLGSGSGFLIEAGGLVVTSYHVVEASSQLKVEIQKREAPDTVVIEGAQVAAVDADRDLALLLLPAAPPEVAVKERYPTIPLRGKPEVVTGETVYALGSPGAGEKILTYTLTKGIVSNPSRLLDQASFIQTTAPVNPGNSGGPLLDKQGKAVGVVGAKGRNVEAVGFAVPASAVKTLLAKRSETPYAVSDGLAAWERKNRPLTALARRGPGYREDSAVKMEGRIDRILAAPRAALYLLDGQAGRISRFNLASRSIEAAFAVDTPVAGMDLDPGAGALYLAAPQKKSVLRLIAESMKLREETPVPSVPMGVSWAGEGVCILQAGEAPRLAPRREVGRKEESVEMEEDRGAAICASSGRWLCLARRDPKEGPSGASIELIAYRMADLKKVLDIAGLRREAKKKGFPAASMARIAALQKEIDGARRNYFISDSIAAKEGAIAGEIVFCGEEKVIFGRRLIALGANLKVEGTLEPGPYSQDERPELKRSRAYYQFMDNVFSASPDGKYAATGTHIYSVKTRKPIRLLPFPTRVHAFSGDGKSLYLFDPYRGALYLLSDWETNAAKA